VKCQFPLVILHIQSRVGVPLSVELLVPYKVACWVQDEIAVPIFQKIYSV